MPVSSSRTSRPSCGCAGVRDGTRVIVQGQDFVREGQRSRRSRRRSSPHGAIARDGAGRQRRTSGVQAHRLRHRPCAADDRDARCSCWLAGFVAYVTIPKEAEPDVRIPIIYVQLTQRGISPEDSERLLLRPVETQLKSVGNVKEMRSTAYEGGGFVLLEFEAGFDSKSALADVRAKVDEAKHDLPKRRRRAAGAGGQSLALSGAGGRALRRRAGAHAAAHRARRQERHRAGAGRAGGGAARRARRGGRDHRRADADEELRRVARAARRRGAGRRTRWSPPARSKARPAGSPSRCRR